MPTVLLIHYAATVFMTGVIWVIQLVHYPLFDRVGDAQFAGYEASHVARITWVVGPPMLAEAFTALALLSSPMPRVPGWVPWVGAALLAVVWLSTAVWQVPQHDVLARGFDRDAYETLVRTNAVRTAAWTARAALLTWALARTLSPVGNP